MGLARGVDEEPRRAGGLNPPRADVEAGARVPRYGQADEIRHRAARDQQSARAGRKPEQLHKPRDHPVLDQSRGVIELGHLRIHSRRQHVGEHPERRAGPDHPAPESRVDVARGVGEDVALELLVHGRRRGGLERQRLGEPCPHVGRDGAPSRARANRGEIVEHVVHHTVAEGAELVPVRGIEGCLAGKRRHVLTSFACRTVGPSDGLTVVALSVRRSARPTARRSL